MLSDDWFSSGGWWVSDTPFLQLPYCRLEGPQLFVSATTVRWSGCLQSFGIQVCRTERNGGRQSRNSSSLQRIWENFSTTTVYWFNMILNSLVNDVIEFDPPVYDKDRQSCEDVLTWEWSCRRKMPSPLLSLRSNDGKGNLNYKYWEFVGTIPVFWSGQVDTLLAKIALEDLEAFAPAVA